MRIGKTREQQQRLRQHRRERAAQLATIGLTHKQIAERLGVAGSTVAELLAEAADSNRSTVLAKTESG
jgi:DNA-binding transcriptional regulator LsrR (DeoR family)